MQHYAWRPMRPADLAAVMAVAAQVHAGYFEAEAVFAERLALFADGCWIAAASVDGEEVVGGYMVMHPARLWQPPALNRLLGQLDGPADVLHLHDIALLEGTRGQGLGQAAVAILRGVVRRQVLAGASLVAVHGSSGYWTRFGFVPGHADPADMATRLESYGEGARYMVWSTD